MAKKGEEVFYTVRGHTYRARVERVHRDGSLTVKALFQTDTETGKDRHGTYLGFDYRVEASDVRPTA